MEGCPPPAVRPVRPGAPGRPDDGARPPPTASTRLPSPSPGRTPADAGRRGTERPRRPRARPREATACGSPPPAPVSYRGRGPAGAGGQPGRRRRERGLTQLLWVNALHMAGDAMVAVSLAGTSSSPPPPTPGAATRAVPPGDDGAVRPAGPGHRPGAGPAAARPALGARGKPRRPWGARAGDGRPLRRRLALPGGAGVRVLSKSHNVLRAAVVPRVLPPALSLTSANARLSVFGLVDGRCRRRTGVRGSRRCWGSAGA